MAPKLSNDNCDMLLKDVLNLSTDSVFGADLTEEMLRTHTEAPLVVIKCIEHIEKACSHHGKYTNLTPSPLTGTF